MSAKLASQGPRSNLSGLVKPQDLQPPADSVDRVAAGSQIAIALDPAVVKELPRGCKIIQVGYHGTAVWAQSAAIETEGVDGIKRRYFIKFNATEKGDVMMRGEFESMSAIYKLAPSLSPHPIAFGRSESMTPVTYFYLARFVDLSNSLASAESFCSQLAKMHRDSKSPTGKFGFHVPTMHGPNLQANGWDDNWARYFTRLISYFFSLEKEANGEWPELEAAFNRLVKNVVPKVLEPLQADGRNIEPKLVHGDLWGGNIATNLDTSNPIIFDAAAFYAHNEYDIGTWTNNNFDPKFFKYYREDFPPSEPVEQWEDRNLLYSLKFQISHSIGWPGLQLHRKWLLANMLYLVHKHENPDIEVAKPSRPDQEALDTEMRELHSHYTFPSEF